MNPIKIDPVSTSVISFLLLLWIVAFLEANFFKPKVANNHKGKITSWFYFIVIILSISIALSTLTQNSSIVSTVLIICAVGVAGLWYLNIRLLLEDKAHWGFIVLMMALFIGMSYQFYNVLKTLVFF